MTNNEVLGRFRDQLNIQEDLLIRIFKNSDYTISKSELKAMLKNPQVPGFVKCKDPMLAAFLDGFIIFKRGPAKNTDTSPNTLTNLASISTSSDKKETGLKKQSSPYLKLTNNTILKKIRIAYKLQDPEMLEIFNLAQREVSKGELSAWFRKPGHKNYKKCPDEAIDKFFIGLEQMLQQQI